MKRQQVAPHALPVRFSHGDVTAVAVGNILTFYDFLVFDLFAVEIGNSLMPAGSSGSRLLASLAVFGVGFLTRPLGALVIGRISDSRGRRMGMLLSFSLMGVAISGLALTPSFARIGVLAPILAVGFRLLQGFAVGGDVGPSTAFLVEKAPAERRGLYASVQFTSADVTVLLVASVGLILSTVMKRTTFDDWGWRIALLLGVLIVPSGILARHSITETPHNNGQTVLDVPVAGTLRVTVAGMAMLVGFLTSWYILIYLSTYATTVLHIQATKAYWASAVFGFCALVFDPLGGWLSDRVGRKAMILVPGVLLLLTVLPCFKLLDHMHSVRVLLIVTALMASLLSLTGVSMMVAVAESFPRTARACGLGLIYAAAATISGGGAQFLVTWLIGIFGDPLVPAYYMMVALFLSLCGVLMLRETAPNILASPTTGASPKRPESLPLRDTSLT